MATIQQLTEKLINFLDALTGSDKATSEAYLNASQALEILTNSEFNTNLFNSFAVDCLDTSTANAWLSTIEGYTAYRDKDLFFVKVYAAPTGATTFQVNSLTAKSVYKNKDVALGEGDFKAGQIISLMYDLVLDSFQVV